MAAKPRKKRADDTPTKVYHRYVGSNNSTGAMLTVWEYPNGDVCVQLEDQQTDKAGELWSNWNGLTGVFGELWKLASERMKGAEEDGSSAGPTRRKR